MNALPTPQPACDDAMAEQPWCDTLARMAAQLERMQDESTRLQATISHLIAQSLDTRAEDVAAMQAIDLLTQQLDGLSTFAAVAASHTPASWTLDLAVSLKAVKLGSLVTALRGADIAADDESFELF